MESHRSTPLPPAVDLIQNKLTATQEQIGAIQIETHETLNEEKTRLDRLEMSPVSKVVVEDSR